MSAVGGIVSDYTATLAVRKLDRLLKVTLFHINNDYWTKLFVELQPNYVLHHSKHKPIYIAGLYP